MNVRMEREKKRRCKRRKAVKRRREKGTDGGGGKEVGRTMERKESIDGWRMCQRDENMDGIRRNEGMREREKDRGRKRRE